MVLLSVMMGVFWKLACEFQTSELVEVRLISGKQRAHYFNSGIGACPCRHVFFRLLLISSAIRNVRSFLLSMVAKLPGNRHVNM